MPIPTFTGLPPYPEFADVVKKVNTIVQEITNLMLNLDSLNVVSLTADHINTGTLLAELVTIMSRLTGDAYIRIDGTGMVINDGTKDVFSVDTTGQVIMTGATVQSASGYPKIQLMSTDKLFSAYKDANNAIQITPDTVGNRPTIVFMDAGAQVATLSYVEAVGILLQLFSGSLSLNAKTDLYLTADAGYVRFVSWDEILNNTTSRTLQQDLNAKQNTISGFTGSFSTGTQTVNVSNGIITSVV